MTENVKVLLCLITCSSLLLTSKKKLVNTNSSLRNKHVMSVEAFSLQLQLNRRNSIVIVEANLPASKLVARVTELNWKTPHLRVGQLFYTVLGTNHCHWDLVTNRRKLDTFCILTYVQNILRKTFKLQCRHRFSSRFELTLIMRPASSFLEESPCVSD